MTDTHVVRLIDETSCVVSRIEVETSKVADAGVILHKGDYYTFQRLSEGEIVFRVSNIMEI